MAKVLVVDDEQTVQQVLRSFLEIDGHQVVTAGSYDEALSCIRRSQADLIVTDVILGPKTGLEILTFVKEEQPNTPVIVITGQPSLETASSCIKAGAFDLLHKPLEHSNFINASRRAIKEGRRLKKIGTLALENRRYRKALGETVERQSVEIERATRALIKSEQRYRMLVEAVPEIILEFDKNYRCVWYNDVALKFFGESLYNRCFEDLSDIEEEKEMLLVRLRELRKNPRGLFQIKFHTSRANRQEKWTSWTVKSLTKPSGEIYGLLATARDITEMALLEERVRQKAKLETIGQLAGGVAHDFNNMLTAILAQTQIVKRAPVLTPPIIEAMGTIEAGVLRARELTRKLLGFAQCGKTKNCPFSSHKIIEEVVALLTRTLDKRINLSTDLDSDRDVIFGDPSQMYQVILNLIVNARDAIMQRFSDAPNPQQSGSIRILSAIFSDQPHCTSAGNQTLITINIQDNGCGIAKEDQERIFEPFFTTKKTQGNSGMGLAMVYGIVSNHDGFVQLDSAPETGTTISVILPLSEEKPIELTPKKQDSARLTRNKATILLVDDEDLVRSSMAALLRSLGFTVLCASSGNEALAIYENVISTIDVIILDLMMPGMEIDTCIEKFKSLRPEIKILLTSGFGLSENAQRLLSLGVSSFIHKPCEVGELVQAISKLDISEEKAASI